MLRALLYAYVLGGLTFIPLLVAAALFYTIYTSVPVDPARRTAAASASGAEAKTAPAATDVPESTPTADAERERPPDGTSAPAAAAAPAATPAAAPRETQDLPRTRKGWLTMRRTFAEPPSDGGYATLVRALLEPRSTAASAGGAGGKGAPRARDAWYAVLKGSVLFLYEDERMSECGAALEMRRHSVGVYPEGLPDGELFARRNALCLRPRAEGGMPSVTKEMRLGGEEAAAATEAEQEKAEAEKEAARAEAEDPATPWFIFVRSNVEMEDWYFALLHAAEQPPGAPTLAPLAPVFDPAHMATLIGALDAQPDVIPMRWLNALLGRIFLSHYRTQALEAYIIGRLMKKLGKVKRPAFLTEIAVTQVAVGSRAPMLSKPMLKELTPEGDAAIEVHMLYKGEVRITVEATAVINLGARFKSYTVKLELAAVLRELEGNLLVKVKRPPSNRIWYAFTQTPRIVLEVEPIVSDRQITWGMILGTIESKFKEIIQESVVMPNMDDIAYFETSMFEHRGGIFAEACRKPHTEPTPEIVVSPEDVQASASAPLPDTVSLSAADTKADEPNTITRSATDVLPATEPEDAPRKDVRRRRSWFAPKEEGGESDGEARSRRGSVGSGPSTPPRVPSTKAESVRAVTPEPREGRHARRASSSHVPAKEAEAEGSVRSAPGTPAKEAERPASPPSFFATLKSKAAAADKQALGNTAKEAMRKWGVNWAGFKKDAEDGTPGSPPGKAGLLGADGTLLGRARTSYAEVRAAVAERKERERPAEEAPPPRARVASTSGVPEGSVYADAPGPAGVVSAAGRLAVPRKAATTVSRVSTDGEAQEATIHVQPVAKTMSIPGIHASHRGEVQAMGHEAPPPPPDPAPTGYRLWKTPSEGEAAKATPPPLPPRNAVVAETAEAALKTIAGRSRLLAPGCHIDRDFALFVCTAMSDLQGLPPPPRGPRKPAVKTEPLAVETFIDRSPQGLAPARGFRLERPLLATAPRGSLDSESLSSLAPASTAENEPRLSISSTVYAASDGPSPPPSLYNDPSSRGSFIDLFDDAASVSAPVSPIHFARPRALSPPPSPLAAPRPHAALVRKSRKLARVFGHTPAAAAVARPLALAARALADPAAPLAVRRHSMPLSPDDVSFLSLTSPPLDAESFIDLDDDDPAPHHRLVPRPSTETLSPEALADDERRRKRERLAKLHRFLGSRVPAHLVLGLDAPPDADPDPDDSSSSAATRRVWRMRRRSSSAAAIPALCADELERVCEVLDDKEKAINVRRAHKMEKVFGVAPPQTLYHTRRCQTPPPAQAAEAEPTPPATPTAAIAASAMPAVRASKGKKSARPGTADSNTQLLPKPGARDSFVYSHYQHSLNSLHDILDRDDRASLAELHEYLNAADAFAASPTTAEAEYDLASNAAAARARRLSVASSAKSERRRSLPARTSRASLASEYTLAGSVLGAAGEEDAGAAFQQRRRRAAKLAQFFGVDYRELVADVIASIEGGVAVEELRGTLRADEVERCGAAGEGESEGMDAAAAARDTTGYDTIS
ncbi:hypothetical protein HYPSUDRAFT_74363 [Hypholoma sublateritium FD-334 SS-4]|uniref:SMP-LTD domain-containing protein n=1 Tax=Hypholoma sublateritium (strain FD-334 SS-4) TaxID=945553 RepID=A0A0D2PCN0_HYPSF|nr:hypothetical protein HYPSUDRAFT_74363 [Hypholoma sublateritium FD-334 SS-4]